MTESSEIGKLLPNLKVTLGAEENLILEEGELLENAESHLPSVSLTRKFLNLNRKSSANTAKEESYNYKGFETGLDLSTEETITRLNKRARRFQLKKEEIHQITVKEINELYKSLGMDSETLETSCRNARLEVIHMRGVKEMNEQEVLDYFRDYGPWKVQWINDVSCNVLWNDSLSAARALLGVSQPMVIKRKSKNGSQIKKSSDSCGSSTESDKPPSAVSEENDAKWISGNTNEEYAVTELEPQYENSAMEVDENTKIVTENDLKLGCEISVPPGYWRIGVPHPKARTILLRFANKDDKKVPGAEERSQYYKKYGNPNYGGMKGYISKSLKRKFKLNNTREAVKHLSVTKEDPSHTSDIKRITKRHNIPVDRMTMYADIEEENKSKKSSHFHGRSSNRESIKKRLGKRYSKDDLLKIGSQFSYKEDAPVEELSVECKIPSRFNIWTEQAKAMSREGLEESEEEMDGLDEVEEEQQIDEEEEEEEEDYSSRRYCAYSSERASYDVQKQYGYSGSSKDLRQTLNSSRRKNNSSRGDLRSRIANLKKDDKTRKHRSPLFRDDF